MSLVVCLRIKSSCGELGKWKLLLLLLLLYSSCHCDIWSDVEKKVGCSRIIELKIPIESSVFR